MTKNKLKNILIFENWIAVYLQIYIKKAVTSSFSFFDVLVINGACLILKERFLAYKNDQETEWNLPILIVLNIFLNWFAIGEIISVLFH